MRAFEPPYKLDLGCGVRKKPGFIGIDYMGETADINIDLATHPIPFPKDSVEEVWSNHFLEHLDIEGVCKVMQEIHRVCKPNALVEIRVPHFSGLTNYYEFHKTSFRYNSFSEFIVDGWGMFNFDTKFELLSTKINLVNRQSPKLRPYTWWHFWNYPMEWLVNKFPLTYELTGWRNFFPAWEIVYKFKVVK